MSDGSGPRARRIIGSSIPILSEAALDKLLERQSEAKVRAALEAGEIDPANEVRVRQWLVAKHEEREAMKSSADADHRARELSAA